MDFQGANFRQGDKAGGVIDDDVWPSRLFLAYRNLPERVGSAHRRMLLKEARFFPSFGTAEEDQRPVGDVRQDPVGNRSVVVCEFKLGNALVGVENLLG